MGRLLLSALIVASVIATAVADLGFMHAGNDIWPPHARMHAVWNVVHVLGTHGLALGLLWLGPRAISIVRVRIAALIMLAYIGSFFVAVAAAPLFGGSVVPDLPPAEMPPQPFGLDGNLFGFLVGLPLIAVAWWLSERAQSSPVGAVSRPRT